MNISTHAINRFRERVSSKGTDEFIRDTLIWLANKAYEVKLKKKFNLRALLAYDCIDAKYLESKYQGTHFILVVINNTITTIHDGDAQRWEYIP